MAPERTLYLYSSNIRPLYEQDILDLLALPRGCTHRFRYKGPKYLEGNVAKEWSSLHGTRVLIHFALQQESQYHEPAFIPVRWGRVVRTEHLGDVYIIEFRLEEFASLRVPEGEGHEKWENPSGKVVQEYLRWLTAHSVPHPYKYWAGFGPDPSQDETAPFNMDQRPLVLFEQTARYLNRTTSFRDARFYWVEGLYRLGEGGGAAEAVAPEDGKFVLAGGSTYAVQVAHCQPVDIKDRETFRISADGERVRPIGSGEFEIASRYDLFMLPIHAAEPATPEAYETVVSIEGMAGVQAPRVKLRVKVVRAKSRTVVAVGGSATAALLLGVPGLYPALPVEYRVVCVILASVLAGVLANWGLRRT